MTHESTPICTNSAAAYRHFANKAELLAAVAQDGFERLGARLRSVRKEGVLDSPESVRERRTSWTKLSRSYRWANTGWPQG
jgi:AcrR family transcriptional regulator